MLSSGFNQSQVLPISNMLNFFLTRLEQTKVFYHDYSFLQTDDGSGVGQKICVHKNHELKYSIFGVVYNYYLCRSFFFRMDFVDGLAVLNL